MSFRSLVITLLFCVVVLLPPMWGQRPKIGLALSGGGAKGLAHIGVLKAIDSAGLQVDYITGTSMGAIIGAMYAAGYSGNEIEARVKALDWDKLLNGRPNYSQVSLDEKDELDNYTAELPVRHGKPVLSTGFLESEEVWLTFSEIFFPVHHIKDFSQFDIPFSCIATDLSTGQPVVINHGEIVWAIRSSMALPSVFAATTWGDTKLVDGGIVRNFPVSDLKAMGADYFIGVNLYSGLSQAKDLKTMLDVMYQITNFRDAEYLQFERGLCNILIEPAMTTYSAASFNNATEIIDIGNQTGQDYYPVFKLLADSLNRLYPPSAQSRPKRVKYDRVVIDGISIEGQVYTSRTMLLQTLDVETGKSYTPEELSARFRKAYASLYYQYVYYELEPTTPGHCRLHCILRENEMQHVKFALGYHSFYNASMTLNYTWRNLLLDKSVSSVKVAIGQNWKTRIQHKQFFGNQLNNLADFSARLERLKMPIYNKNLLYDIYQGYDLRLNLEYLRLKGIHWGYGGGVGAGFTYFEPDVMTANHFEGSLVMPYTYITVRHNSLDRRFLPTSGKLLNIKFSAGISRQIDYMTLSGGQRVDTLYYPPNPLFSFAMQYESYRQTGSRTTLFAQMHGGYTQNNENLIFDRIVLGGIQTHLANQIPFAGLLDAQLTSTSVLAASIGCHYRMFGDLFLIGRANAAAHGFRFPMGNEKPVAPKFISGFSLGTALNFSLLPMEFNLMYSPYINSIYSHLRVGFLF
ncbi:MAG: patatin-like phospholipase family protein [Marinilabiliaceae bacterium]|nr:patatin-like phospholipase family protein [Marinilabiliaceae bacterium]